MEQAGGHAGQLSTQCRGDQCLPEGWSGLHLPATPARTPACLHARPPVARLPCPPARPLGTQPSPTSPLAPHRLHPHPKQALDLKPNYMRAWTNMGISQANLADYESSARFYVR